MKRIKILLLSILMIFNIDKVDALGSNTVDFNEKGSILDDVNGPIMASSVLGGGFIGSENENPSPVSNEQ